MELEIYRRYVLLDVQAIKQGTGFSLPLFMSICGLYTGFQCVVVYYPSPSSIVRRMSTISVRRKPYSSKLRAAWILAVAVSLASSTISRKQESAGFRLCFACEAASSIISETAF